MRRWLARLPLRAYEKALPAFDAWIFHPQRLSWIARFTLTLAVVFCAALVAVSVYVLCHMTPPLGAHQKGVRLIGNAVLMAGGAMVFFQVSLKAGNKLLGWCAEGARAEQNAIMAHLEEYSTVEVEGEQTLFLQHHRQLRHRGTLYTLWPVEWWVARVLWSEKRHQRLKYWRMEHVLPRAGNVPCLPKARL